MKHRYYFTAILFVLLLAVLVACGVRLPLVEPETAAPSEPQVEAVQPDVEPATIIEVASDSAFYAVNPELMVAERFVAVPAEPALTTESTFYAANPELMATGRYVVPAEPELAAESTFYAANPELMVANRAASLLIKDEPATESTFYAANPELMAAGRYVVPAEPELAAESALYAINPELMVVQRYAAPAAASDGQESVEPGFQFIRLH